MPVPLEKLVKYIEDSGVLAGDTLKDFLPPKTDLKDGEELARELIRKKKLTKYQAQELYQGKGKLLVLGNYVILEKIGAGGMGQVFKAEHRRMHRIVAIKLLPAGMMKDPAVIARFEREVTAAARLNHPNIVTAFDADKVNGVHFLVMECVEGSDLAALVKKNGPFPVEQAVNYVLQTARGLEAAHSEGIVHRDIKPANLLLDKKGTVKILDMGLARIGGDAPGQAELTSTGTIMGTVDYMAPEQALNTKGADARADIYSLGCSLYYLLTGKATYGGDTLMAKLLAHRDQPIPSIREVRSDVPEQIEAIFCKMVAKRVDDRYQTIGEVIADLMRLTNGQEPQATPQPSSGSLADTGLTDFLRDVSLAPATRVNRQKAAFDKNWIDKNKKLLQIGGGALGALILLAGLLISLSGDKTSITAKLKPLNGKAEVAEKQQNQDEPAKSGSSQKNQPWNTAAFQKWITTVSALPAQEQVEAVTKRLQELNPAFVRAHATSKIENAVVQELSIHSNDVTDISPIRALANLKELTLYGRGADNRLADLSPLKGMPLQQLKIGWSQVEDLSPLEGMPLKFLELHPHRVTKLTALKGMRLSSLAVHSPVSDLSPIKEMNLTNLDIAGSQVTDLSPLEGMSLNSITCDLKPGLDIQMLRSFKSLQWINGKPTAEFWKDWAGGANNVAGGWVSLFNGRDLTGWKPHPEDRAKWEVKDGILIGSGPETGHLFTQRDDFVDFHFRVEAKINDFGNSGQYFRAQFEKNYPRGYEAQINSTHPDPNKTGTLYNLAPIQEMLVKPDEWFTQEVIAEGNHIRILVNGKQVVDHVDDKNSYTKGHFALQHHKGSGSHETVVQFRKIEVKELPGGPVATSQGGAAFDALQGRWVIEGTEEVNGKPMPEISEKRFVFSDRKLTMTRKNNGTPGKYEGTFTADAASGHFDFSGTGPGGNPVTWRGIYKRDGEALILCYKYVKDGNTPRPTAFKTDDKAGTPFVMVRLQRDPQGAVSKSPPQDAVGFEGHAYKFFPDVVTWHEAKSRCQAMGGHLAVVTSAAQDRFIIELAKKGILQPANLDGVWLGATDEQKEGDWRSIDGKTLGFKEWGPGQPNNKENNEHYLMLYLADGNWSDQPAKSVQHTVYFVCEWDTAR